MPAAKPRILKTAIDTGSFDPVYVLHGAEDHLKEEALRQVMSRAVDPAMRDFNVDVRRGSDLDAAGLRSVLWVVGEYIRIVADEGGAATGVDDDRLRSRVQLSDPGVDVATDVRAGFIGGVQVKGHCAATSGRRRFGQSDTERGKYACCRGVEMRGRRGLHATCQQ